jgi:tetratricopeptide (TPR) repeat protein
VSAEDRERLQALGYVGTRVHPTTVAAGTLPDPKDTHARLETYRQAIELAGDRKWGQAIALLQRVLREDPGMVEAWDQVAAFAIRLEHYDQAIDAYKHVIELDPKDPAAYLGAAAAMLKLRKLDEAGAHAALAISVAGDRDAGGRAAGHELLARIALARHDADGARREAALTRESDPKLPLPTYVEARLLYDQGDYAEALPLFEQASAELKRSGDRAIAELHFYTADTLVHLERVAEAEQEFVKELQVSPQSTRARAGLAALYHANGQSDDVARVLDDMVKIAPTPDAYAQAARLWTTFGNRQQADAVRGQARRMFNAAPAPARRTARQ